MARRRRETAPPAGTDVSAIAADVRETMWIIDPETGEWARVKQFTRRASVCSWSGRNDVRISLYKFGEREMSPDTVVTIRRPVVSDAEEVT